MKYTALIILYSVSVAPLPAIAQKTIVLNTKTTSFYQQSLPQVKPAYKNYVVQSIAAVKNKTINIDSLRKAIHANPLTSNLGNQDIEDVAMLILQGANAATYQDINNMLKEMEKARQKKDALRKEEEMLKAQLKKLRDSAGMKVPVYDAAAINKKLDKLKDEKDSLGEMSEQDQLQLQQMMEKKNQLEAMISNIMKAFGETQHTISSNLKGS